MQARWYDPGSGGFLSVDPVVRSIGNPQSANAYSYIENNPVNGVDPTGEFALIAAAVVVTWFIIPVGAAGMFGGAPAARSATKGAMLGAGIAGSALLVPAVLSRVAASGVAVQAGISPTAVAAAPAVVGKALDMLADTGGASTGASTGSDRADAWLDLPGAAKDVADSISDPRDGSTPDTGGASQGTRSNAGSGSNRSTASPAGSGGTPSSAASASGFAEASFAFGAGGSSAFNVIGGVGVTTFSNGVVGYTPIVDCPCAPF